MAAGLLFGTAQAVPAASIVPADTSATTTTTALSFTDQVIALINQQRQGAGLAPLTVNPLLITSAASYSQVLASGTCWAHTCGPVPDFTQCDALAGYTGWTTVGENIAAGQTTPQAVVAAWLASPEHYVNIMNPAHTTTGVGVAYGGPDGIYWDQEFGAGGIGQTYTAPTLTTPAPVPSVPASAPAVEQLLATAAPLAPAPVQIAPVAAAIAPVQSAPVQTASMAAAPVVPVVAPVQLAPLAPLTPLHVGGFAANAAPTALEHAAISSAARAPHDRGQGSQHGAVASIFNRIAGATIVPATHEAKAEQPKQAEKHEVKAEQQEAKAVQHEAKAEQPKQAEKHEAKPAQAAQPAKAADKGHRK